MPRRPDVRRRAGSSGLVRASRIASTYPATCWVPGVTPRAGVWIDDNTGVESRTFVGQSCIPCGGVRREPPSRGSVLPATPCEQYDYSLVEVLCRTSPPEAASGAHRSAAQFALSIALLSPPAAAAQETARGAQPVGVGFDVDTSRKTAPEWGETGSQRPLPTIFRAWAAHIRTALAGHPDYSPSSARGRVLGPYPDLTAVSAYQDFPATVVAIRPAMPDETSEYLVQTLFASRTLAWSDRLP